eukprot:5543695-Prorocentrum_lima.AAC.1
MADPASPGPARLLLCSGTRSNVLTLLNAGTDGTLTTLSDVNIFSTWRGNWSQRPTALSILLQMKPCRLPLRSLPFA